MKSIFWEQEPKDKLVVDLIAPDKKRKLTLAEAAKMFESKKSELPVQRKYVLASYLKILQRAMKPTTDLCAVNVGQNIQIASKFQNGSHKLKFRAALPAFLRFALGVEPNERSLVDNGNGQHPVQLKIKTADISTLGELLATATGKHARLKTQVFDSILECPPGEYRVIEVTKEIIENEKERYNIRSAVQKTIQSKGWVIKWSAARNVFFVVRKSDLTKNGAKA